MSETFFFIVLLDVPDDLEATFNTIYDTDHLPCMMQLSGIRRCDRYRLDRSDNDDMLRYLATYEIDDPELPRSEEWDRHGDMGRWTAEVRHKVTGRQNGVFRKVSGHMAPGATTASPEAVGREHLYFLQQDIPDALEDRFDRLYGTDHIPHMLQVSGNRSCFHYKLHYSQSGNVPRYLTLYDIASPDLPWSPEWQARMSEGEWPAIRPNITATRNGSYSRLAQFSNA